MKAGAGDVQKLTVDTVPLWRKRSHTLSVDKERRRVK